MALIVGAIVLLSAISGIDATVSSADQKASQQTTLEAPLVTPTNTAQ